MRVMKKSIWPIVCGAGLVPLGLAVASPASVNGVSAQTSAHSRAAIKALPAALRPALYGVLAKGARAAYAVNEAGCAVLPQQKLRACFGVRGIRFSGTAAAPLALRFEAFGRGNNLVSVQTGHRRIRDNQVSYTHGTLSEWWRVLPIGFEQGFTLAKRPVGQGELMLVLAASDQAIERNHTLAWGRLRYGDLVVTDARGKVVPATLKHKGDRILIAVNDVHAAYPLTVDPLVWLEQKVSPQNGEEGNGFGWGIALDGATALIGAPAATVGGNTGQGAAYVFTDQDGVWTQTQELTASDGAANVGFGGAVALDGSTAVIGAPGATVHGNAGQGAAYVFSESGGTWSQEQKLTASDGAAGDGFGAVVALDGPTALVGVPYAPVVGSNFQQGEAYVFTESGGTWDQTQKLTASDGAAGDHFGWAIALDGATALVGAPYDVVGSNIDQGSVYVFDETSGTWSQTQKLTASDGAEFDEFGVSVALDGAGALIGAAYATVHGYDARGTAYVFNEAGGTWSQTQKLVASDGAAGDEFGISVALDATTALVGAFKFDGGAPGAAYVFGEAEGTWSQTQKLTASDGVAGDWFGNAVALSDGTALVAAIQAYAGGHLGAAYFYGRSDLGFAVSAPDTVAQGQNYVSQAIATNNASVASPAVAVTVAVPAAASFVSASASQGSCSEDSDVVTCDFGQISGNAGIATANVTLKAIGVVGETIENTASVAYATPILSASTPTMITEGGTCPEGYSEYDGSLNAGQRVYSPIYRAPAGEENAILTAPAGFQLYAVFQNAQGRKSFRIPGNEVHRRAPAGTYTWVVKAGDTGGTYTLCVQHP